MSIASTFELGDTSGSLACSLVKGHWSGVKLVSLSWLSGMEFDQRCGHKSGAPHFFGHLHCWIVQAFKRCSSLKHVLLKVMVALESKIDAVALEQSTQSNQSSASGEEETTTAQAIQT